MYLDLFLSEGFASNVCLRVGLTPSCLILQDIQARWRGGGGGGATSPARPVLRQDISGRHQLGTQWKMSRNERAIVDALVDGRSVRPRSGSHPTPPGWGGHPGARAVNSGCLHLLFSRYRGVRNQFEGPEEHSFGAQLPMWNSETTLLGRRGGPPSPQQSPSPLPLLLVRWKDVEHKRIDDNACGVLSESETGVAMWSPTSRSRQPRDLPLQSKDRIFFKLFL